VFLLISLAYYLYGALTGVAFVGLCARNGCTNTAVQGGMVWLLFYSNLLIVLAHLFLNIIKPNVLNSLQKYKVDIIVFSSIGFGIATLVGFLQSAKI
jgi:hypothetical protein